MKQYIVFASMGFELIGLIIGSFYLGRFLDEKYQTGGLIFVGLSLLCLCGWLWRVIWLLRRFQKREEEEQRQKPEPPSSL